MLLGYNHHSMLKKMRLIWQLKLLEKFVKKLNKSEKFYKHIRYFKKRIKKYN